MRDWTDIAAFVLFTIGCVAVVLMMMGFVWLLAAAIGG
jgi:hypothetical protein